ncbi:adenosine deaminase family protein [Pseudoclavibacter sp. CFCC 11306]|uniref:adenosine deaminase family protein n=1 Tax=Pseudoclavibacter sp. CFCC 11306 TaxID=1564493 RepID=UPI0013016608|nr:adenosine deaminase [Pseudoclavibacter sp. CFCC 11306]KAB1656963.1 adenosine deaminase [Pseudoclavibacter sp. CFCC 11306]
MPSLIDLHIHLPGTVRAATLQELADKNSVALPLPAADLYPRINSDPTEAERSHGPWFPLLRVYELISDSLQTREDFARVVFEALEDGQRDSDLCYAELAFSPSVHMQNGVAYGEMAAGIADGLSRARSELGVDGRAIAAVNREDTAAVAEQMVQTVIDNPSDDIVGIGLDFYELAGFPEKFAAAFQLAGRHGLHRTAHAGEHAPTAATVATALDVLGCDRIDHGYQILRDPQLVERCAEQGTIFNIAFTTSRRALLQWRRESVAGMVAGGLHVTVNSDDPSLFPTTLRREMKIAAEVIPDKDQSWLLNNSVNATFLDAEDKSELRARVFGD